MFRFSNGTFIRDLNLDFTHIYNITNNCHTLKVKDVKCAFSMLLQWFCPEDGCGKYFRNVGKFLASVIAHKVIFTAFVVYLTTISRFFYTDAFSRRSYCVCHDLFSKNCLRDRCRLVTSSLMQQNWTVCCAFDVYCCTAAVWWISCMMRHGI